MVNGQAADCIIHRDLSNRDEMADIPANTFVCTTPDTLMRTVFELRQYSGLPVLLVDEQRFMGVVGDRETYQGLLRKV